MVLMTDHPGWTPMNGGGWCRMLANDHGSRWLAAGTLGGARPNRATGDGPKPLPSLVQLPKGAPARVPALAGAIEGLGTVSRFANPSLWDALATAIVRQVIRAGQATLLYRQFAAAHGHSLDVLGTQIAVFPDPETVLGLTDEQFSRAGLAFHRPALRAGACAFLESGDRWHTLGPADLVVALQQVPRVGAWTAGAAVADFTNDFALYPYSDLAVRTWPGRAAPEHPWPVKAAEFGTEWAQLAGPHLSPLTMLTLAWGKYHADHPLPAP